MADKKRASDTWVPKIGQIVRLKRGISQSFEFRQLENAFKKDGRSLDLDEHDHYEVVEYKKGKAHATLRLRRVHVQYIIGKRLISLGKELAAALDVHFFELAKENEE